MMGNPTESPRHPDLAERVFEIVSRYWLAMLAGVLLLVTHWWAVRYWWDTWFVKNSYYSHGPLVPLIALVMIWANRKRLAQAKIQPSWLGLLLVVPAIPVFLFGRWTSSAALLSLTFFVFLFGGLLLFTGTRMTRLLLFPVLYLAFMVPLPSTLLDEATMKIQLQSTTVATHMLSVSGYDVTQKGSQIESYSLPEPLRVGVPCSGFKLLVSLITFTVFFVYMVSAPWWKKALLIAISFPLSLFINALRITMIGYAGIWVGTADAMHKFHDWSGYLGLIICFVMLFGFAKLIKADKFGLVSPAGEDAPGFDRQPRRFIGGFRGLAFVVLLIALIVTGVIAKPLEATTKGRLDRATVPESFGIWTCHEVPIEKEVSDLLWSGDLLQRVYVSNDTGKQIVVFLDVAKDTTAFHDPHSCLPGSNNTITQDSRITLRIKRPKPMTIDAALLKATGDYGSSVVIHWYMSGATSYSSTPLMRRAVRKQQLLDFVDVATHPTRADEIREEIDQRQLYWYRFSTDMYDESDVETLKQFIVEYLARTKGFGS